MKWKNHSHFQWPGVLCQKTGSSQRTGRTRRSLSIPFQSLPNMQFKLLQEIVTSTRKYNVFILTVIRFRVRLLNTWHKVRQCNIDWQKCTFTVWDWSTPTLYLDAIKCVLMDVINCYKKTQLNISTQGNHAIIKDETNEWRREFHLSLNRNDQGSYCPLKTL